MKKITGRGLALYIFIAILAVGILLFTVRVFTNGSEWALQEYNDTIYTDGSLNAGTITDRNGTVLASLSKNGVAYSSDYNTRLSTLHLLGDMDGNIGTGAIYLYDKELAGYNPVTGLYSFNGRGGRLEMSVDTEINCTAFEALAGRSGTIAVADCKTGELLCMVSSPAFDVYDEDLDLDSGELDGVFLNRFLSCSFTPGSVFKLVTACAALENIEDIDTKTYYCDGDYYIGDDYIACTGYHGEITLKEALACSCNCVFGQIAVELGSKTLCDYAKQYGLLSPCMIDGIASETGSFKTAREGSSDLAWSGIGQYRDLVNPASMLSFMTAIENGGCRKELTLLKNGKNAKTERIMKESTAYILKEMMHNDVVENYGEDNFPGITMYAKSGTAEVGDNAPHAWFVGFGEKEGRTLAFVVVIENGGWGSIEAGAAANTVLQKAFDCLR